MEKTDIEFVNHASVLIKSAHGSILTDPWYKGDAFNKGWNLLEETSDNDVKALLDKTSY